MKQYDIAVIGGGPAGYIAAIKGAQLGAEVILFEKDVLGGTCLNRGCIPTKTYLKGAEAIHQIRSASGYGIMNDSTITVDMKKAVLHKNSVVKQLTQGVGGLLKSNRVRVVYGEAQMAGENTITCGGEVYSANNIILCGGSKTHRIPIPGIEDGNVLTSDEILDLQEVPEKLAIIGGGVIGCEMAAVFSHYGSSVTVIEAESRILPQMDVELSEALSDSFRKQKVEILTSHAVEKITRSGSRSVICCAGGKAVEADKILLSIGRVSDLNCLGALKDRISQERGKVIVDEYMKTNIPNIYAAGDINGKSMLAHSAFKMGEAAAENAMGGHVKCSLKYVPGCVYTLPECAGAGLTEEAACEKYGSENISVGKFPFSANGRALASGAPEGFVKVIAEKRYGELLGVHIFGTDAAEMIAEAVSLMTAEIPADEIAGMIHAHPTYSEAFMEACADSAGRCMHLPARGK